MRAFTVRQVMRGDAPTLHEIAPFSDIVQYFLVNSLPFCFVIGEDRTLRGMISIHDVKVSLQEETLGTLVIAKDLAQTCRIITSPDETLAQCLEKFARTELEYLPVVLETGKLQGVISRRDVLDLYNQEILRREYLGLHLRSERMSSTVSKQVRLPREYTVDVIPVPPRWVGGSLRDAQMRTRFHVTVVAIRRGGFDRPMNCRSRLAARHKGLPCLSRSAGGYSSFRDHGYEPRPYSVSGVTTSPTAPRKRRNTPAIPSSLTEWRRF